MPRECGGTCFVSSKDSKIKPLAGYPICAGLQPQLALHRIIPSTVAETQRKAGGTAIIRASNKKPGRDGRVEFCRAGEDPEPEKAESIFGDDRSRTIGIEFVAEAGLNLVFGQMMGGGHRPQGFRGEGKVRATAEIGVAVFGPDRPVVGDGIFEAAADRPAGAGLRILLGQEGRKADRVIILEAGEGGAAGAVDEDAVEGDTETGADRTLHDRARAPRNPTPQRNHRRRCSPGDARAVDRSFEARDPLGDLQIVAEMGAADYPLRIIVERCNGNTNDCHIDGLAAPGIAYLAADIEATPGEDRRRRQIDRRRPAVRKIGRKGRTGECDGGSRRQQDLTAHGVFSVRWKMNFEIPTPLWRARNHYWLWKRAIPTAVTYPQQARTAKKP